MKKRIERLLVSTFQLSTGIIQFQRKAHEKEDWECSALSGLILTIFVSFREKLMKKRIESVLPYVIVIHVYNLSFQRKAHEKEDWESFKNRSHYCIFQKRFQRKAHEKEDWELKIIKVTVLPYVVFQRKAHEKEDWETLAKNSLDNRRHHQFQRKAHEKEDWEGLEWAKRW